MNLLPPENLRDAEEYLADFLNQFIDCADQEELIAVGEFIISRCKSPVIKGEPCRFCHQIKHRIEIIKSFGEPN